MWVMGWNSSALGSKQVGNLTKPVSPIWRFNVEEMEGKWFFVTAEFTEKGGLSGGGGGE